MATIEHPTPPPTPPQNIKPLQIEDELKDSYLSYAMSVIISRALPDVRDGLKPSQRRILVAMNDLNLSPRAKTSKCAGIVGETMKRYHPHGDNAIYPTLVRMAQPFSTRYPLVAGQGNFGSIDGLPAAAMRYTEAKMSAVTEEMMQDLTRDTVNFIPNYDETTEEPVVLPSKFPNLICNGATGIAVGMATSVPPHNLTEICAAVIHLIDHPDTRVHDLLDIVTGPDFPTGGLICGRRGIIEGYLTGRSTITMRARTVLEEDGKRTNIIVTEIPFQQAKERLVKKMAEAVKEGRIEGISDIRDESGRQGIRIVVELRRDAEPEVVLNQLFKFSPLQDTFSVIMLALVDNRPRTLNLLEMLQQFIRHRVTVIRRRTEYLLRQARARAHLVAGLLVALEYIDAIIQIIRGSQTPAEARARLMGMEVSAQIMQRALNDPAAPPSGNLTRLQADAILQMQLQRLTGLEKDKLAQEFIGLRREIAESEAILADEARIRAIIRADMEELRAKYGDPRRTEIVGEAGDILDEDLIAQEMMVVTISHEGYIKRVPSNTYQAQGRGGKGKSAGDTKEDDFIEHLFVANTHDSILFFTDRGKVYWRKVYELPLMARTARGRAIVNVVELAPDEKVTSLIPVRVFDGRELVMATRCGVIKKTPLKAYSRPKQGGIIAIRLDEGDELIGVALTHPGDELVISSRNGRSLRFAESQVRSMGRSAHGVRGIRLQGMEDRVVGLAVVRPGGSLLTVCERGYGKRTPFAEYPTKHRGGQGVLNIKTTDRNGPVVGTATVTDSDQVMMITVGGLIVRLAMADLRPIGRNTQGVRLIHVAEGDRVASLALAPEEEVSDEALAQGAEPPVPVADAHPELGDGATDLVDEAEELDEAGEDELDGEDE